MDTEPEELQFQGPVGVCRESCKLLLGPWRRLFGGIALAFAFPLSLAYLSHIAFTDIVSARIGRNAEALERTPSGSAAEDRILSRIASEWGALMLFKAGYLLAVLVLSLFSTAAAVYSVACAYAGSGGEEGSPPSLRKVLAVVPRVWRRLAVTFLWSFAVVLCYNVVAVLVILIAILLAGPGWAGLLLVVALLLVYLAGLVYIGVVWHVAGVVSVLEEAGGLEAMRKSQRLLKGKEWTAVGIFLALQAALVMVELAFRRLVVKSGGGEGGTGSAGSWVVRAWHGAGIAAALTAVVMLGLVAQAVVYFVCKAYHHESIDKSNLADHLEEYYLGEYVPLKSKDVQMESFQV